MNANSTAALIYNMWYHVFLSGIMIGSGLNKKQLFGIVHSLDFGPFICNEFKNLEYTSPLFMDIIDKNLKTSLQDVIYSSLKDTLAFLGIEFESLQYGDFHKISFVQSPFGRTNSTLLKALFNSVHRDGGNENTPNAKVYSFYPDEFPFSNIEVDAQPGVRMITDFSNMQTYFSISTGESGDILSRHYSDFLEDYINGIYYSYDLDRL